MIKTEKNAKSDNFGAKLSKKKCFFVTFAPKCWSSVLLPDLAGFLLYYYEKPAFICENKKKKALFWNKTFRANLKNLFLHQNCYFLCFLAQKML